MRSRQHEIPTHLNVEDKLLLGMTARQFLYVLVGTSLSYGMWNQLIDAAPVLRLTIVASCLLAAAAMAWLRPLERPLEEWLLAVCVYVGTPRRAVWRPCEPEAAAWRPAAGVWHELRPNLTWLDDIDDGDEEVP
jgi:hypothetical protein